MLPTTSDFIWFITLSALIIVLMISFFFFVLVKNVKVRKAAEVGIRDAIISTQEQEQNRIAEDLHDELGPMLSAVKLKVSTMSDLNHEELNESVSKVEEYLDKAISDVRLVARSLSSNLIGKYGIKQSLEEFVNLLSETRQMKVDLQIEIDGDLPGDVQTNVYRIARELINNSIKHSTSKYAKLILKYKNDYLEMKYDDDGTGNAPNSDGKGMGQSSIRNRLNLMKANIISFTENFSGGAHYHFKIPIITA